MPRKYSFLPSIRFLTVLAVFIALMTPLNSNKPAYGDVASPKAATGTNVVLPLPIAIVEGTVNYAQQNAPPEVQAAIQGMVSYVETFPPATEPALVDLLGLLSGSGSPPFVINGSFVGRGVPWNSSRERGPIAELAAAGGYEDLPIIFMSPVVLDVYDAASPDQIDSMATPHPYTLDTARTAIFDINGDGYPDLTEWVAANLAILVIPAMPECIFELERMWQCPHPISGRDLVGTGGGYRNGFERLRVYDLDQDSRVKGVELAPFYLWTDLNGNAVADTGELFKPEDLGITELVIPESGLEGTFVRADTSTGAMWDWWPTYAPLRRSPGKAAYWQQITLHGQVESIGTADLVTTVPVAKGASTSTHGRPDRIELAGLGWNANESLLACLDPSGAHVACVDYRPDPPHTARIWILSRTEESTWDVYRFALPESEVGQVTFDDTGNQCLAVSPSETYILTGWAEGSSGSLGRMAWQDGDFRAWWGSAFAVRGNALPVDGQYYIPGYIHQADGTPLCDAVMQLTVSGTDATLSPVSDVHALAGEYLPSLGTGLDPAYAYFLKSPQLSFALARNADQNTSLLAIDSGPPGGWHANQIDEAQAIAGLCATGKRVHYIVQREGGQWELCWADTETGRKGAADPIRIPSSQRPSCPELADNGTRLLWMTLDWSAGKATLMTANAAGDAIPLTILQDIAIPGPLRVAERAPYYAVQTQTGLLIGSAQPWWEAPGVPVSGLISLAILLLCTALLATHILTRRATLTMQHPKA